MAILMTARMELELLTVLKRMVRENDLAVLLSLHELELAERISDTVVCVTGDRIDRIGPLEGTKVLMKSGRAIHETVDALERHGLAARAGMVADCGLETEQVYTDLRQLPEEISYFAAIVAD